MGIKFGEIDSSQILNNEFKIMVLERIVEQLVASNPAIGNAIDIKRIREESVKALQEKYPNSGIELQG